MRLGGGGFVSALAASSLGRQHLLYLTPEPQGHGRFRPGAGTDTLLRRLPRAREVPVASRYQHRDRPLDSRSVARFAAVIRPELPWREPARLFPNPGVAHSNRTAVAASREHYMRTVESAPQLAERVRAGKREERFYGTTDPFRENLPTAARRRVRPGAPLQGSTPVRATSCAL
jgi:hypothetical protein